MIIDYELGIKILFASGITNIIFLLLVFFSCRCMGRAKILNKAFEYKRYQKFYSKHCYFWWGFVISVLIHTLTAFYLFGFPF